MTEPSEPPPLSGLPWEEGLVSALNGVVGDYLHKRGNGLAIPMAWYQQNRPLTLTAPDLHAACPQLTPKLCLLVHGLACNEGIWRFREDEAAYAGTSYGALLHKELGYTPLYLRYNTGLPIAANGKRLAALIDELFQAYPLPLDEIVLIGHSMGGLLIRSACHYGVDHGHAWVKQVRRIFYLGTPHTGSYLEQLGHALTSTLNFVNGPITRLIGKVGNVRSQGIKDLRRATIHDEMEPDDGVRVSWLPQAAHYLVAGSITDNPNHVLSHMVGDMLVHLRSAQGGKSVPTPHNVRLFPAIGHIRLAHHPEVYQQIKAWCQEQTVDG